MQLVRRKEQGGTQLSDNNIELILNMFLAGYGYHAIAKRMVKTADDPCNIHKRLGKDYKTVRRIVKIYLPER